MDGVFMKKFVRRVLLCLMIVTLVGTGMLIADRQTLKKSLIRLHVVANSDDQNDQNVKLLVRDAVIQSIQEDLSDVADMEQAKAYLQENLPKIQSLANMVLEAAGFEQQAVVSLCQESFITREYDTFTLPAGVYEALRIVIGEGEGQNWWCVAFPSLCIPATSAGFVETAADAGLPDHLTETLAGKQEYKLRFCLLDTIGKVENYFFQK